MVDIDIPSIKRRFGIIGNAPQLNRAIEVASQVAATDMSVLITGESGTGKESFSKIIHQLSARKHGQFIAVNCGAIPEGTIDSELFGHEKGSFTGAYEARKGYFEVTDGGTIFLDEIGETPIGTQARLLRVLENGEFIKVGSSKVLKTNVRVVTATNVNLLVAVEKGKFREDLYYRLNTVPVLVPSLRDRGSDVYLLFRKFATDFADQYSVDPISLTEDAVDLLLKSHFPGNIRQLKNLVEQISVLEMDKKISLERLATYLPNRDKALPALYYQGRESNTKNDFSERDILYKILFDLRNDFNELKKLMMEVLQEDNPNSGDILNKHKEFFQNIQKRESRNISTLNKKLDDKDSYLLKNAEESVENRLHVKHLEKSSKDQYIEDVALEEAEEKESLSIEDKEKELIIKALKRNHNKRKYAAQNLGISERTLYRKIKQYSIQ